MVSSHFSTANATFVQINQVPLPRIWFCRYAMPQKDIPAIHSLTEELADEKDIRPGGGYRDPVVGFGM
jgi:hypothetical protein